MEEFLSTVLENISKCEVAEEIIKIVSSLHSFLDLRCERELSTSEIDNAIESLIKVDNAIFSRRESFDELILQQTLKRLIAFYKVISNADNPIPLSAL
jgi:hypothetical protein